jgi:hypothetical protein
MRIASGFGVLASLRSHAKNAGKSLGLFSGGGTVAEPVRGLTMILGRARAGDERARGELIALSYDELRRVASRLMRRERPDHTLPPTAVVHEAVIRLLGEGVFDRVEHDWRLARAWLAGQLGGWDG